MKRYAVLLGSLAVSACSPPADDATAIRQVLEKESATWRTGDVASHAACWHPQPYSRILVSTAEGKMLDVPPATMLTKAAGMGQGGTSANTNYKMHIAGNDAWVSHDEVSTAKDGQKTYSSEIRMLEKIDNHWKLVGESIHVYAR